MERYLIKQIDISLNKSLEVPAVVGLLPGLYRLMPIGLLS